MVNGILLDFPSTIVWFKYHGQIYIYKEMANPFFVEFIIQVVFVQKHSVFKSNRILKS